MLAMLLPFAIGLLPQEVSPAHASPDGRWRLSIVNTHGAKSKRAQEDARYAAISKIYLQRERGDSMIVHTTALGTEAKFVRWSPDSRRAYFIEDMAWAVSINADGNYVFEVNAETGKVRRVLVSRGVPGDAVMMGFSKWIVDSPDHRAIAVVHGGGRLLADSNQIDVITLDPRSQRRLTPPSLCAIDPAWSPDGKWMAFSGQPQKNGDYAVRMGIYTIRAAGGQAKRLTTPPVGYSDELPEFTRDGRQIRFWRVGEKGSVRYIVSAEGGRATQLGNLTAVDTEELRRTARS